MGDVIYFESASEDICVRVCVRVCALWMKRPLGMFFITWPSSVICIFMTNLCSSSRHACGPIGLPLSVIKALQM